MPNGPHFCNIYHPNYLLHDTGGDNHPEIPDRLRVIKSALSSLESIIPFSTIEPAPAEQKWLLNIHTEEYLLHFEEVALCGRSYLDHTDNQLCYETYEIALLAAGAGLAGIDYLEQEPGGSVFCSVRPPGHHAERSVAMGFCFLNNIAIAARYWQMKYERQRIAIIDFDAHHGNGIQSAFEEDPNILYVSTHEHPNFSFPGTGFSQDKGSGPGQGATLNIPLPSGAGTPEIKEAFSTQIEPMVERFRPEAIIVAAGFDAHKFDDMSGLLFPTELYGYIGGRIATLAKSLCNGRIISILEGGYHLPSLGNSAKEYCQGLIKYK